VFSEARRSRPAGKKTPEEFSYSSGNNREWMEIEEIRERLRSINL